MKLEKPLLCAWRNAIGDDPSTQEAMQREVLFKSHGFNETLGGPSWVPDGEIGSLHAQSIGAVNHRESLPSTSDRVEGIRVLPRKQGSSAVQFIGRAGI